MAKIVSADLLNCDEHIAIAMGKEQYEGDAFQAKPEANRQRELLPKGLFNFGG